MCPRSTKERLPRCQPSLLFGQKLASYLLCHKSIGVTPSPPASRGARRPSEESRANDRKDFIPISTVVCMSLPSHMSSEIARTKHGARARSPHDLSTVLNPTGEIWAVRRGGAGGGAPERLHASPLRRDVDAGPLARRPLGHPRIHAERWVFCRNCGTTTYPRAPSHAASKRTSPGDAPRSFSLKFYGSGRCSATPAGAASALLSSGRGAGR